MPYDRALPADRERIQRRLDRYWPNGVPESAVDQFAEVFNSVLGGSNDEGLAFERAMGVAKKRSAREHAACCGTTPRPEHASAGARSVGKLLANTITQQVLKDLKNLAENCDCGRTHNQTLTALRLALSQRAEHPGAGAYESAQVGIADVGWVWNRIAKDIYSQGDKVFLAVREMLQNSRDARAKNIQITWEPDPYNRDLATLTFQDDGKGMSREVVQTKFMALGGTLKEEGSLGGFGAAKAAILTASTTGWSWDLRTRNVHAYSEGSGAYAIAELDEHLSGTRITLPAMANTSMEAPIGSGSPIDRIRALMWVSDLRGINVTINGEPAGSYYEGRRGRNEVNWEQQSWGFPVRIKSYKREDNEGGVIIVRVKGLAQFAEAAPGGSSFDRDWLIDFEIPSEITPQSDRYPFTAGRDEFRWGTTAYYTFRSLRDTLVKAAASGEKDLGEYIEIAPDATDPREKKAEAKFAQTIESVMSSDTMVDTFQTLGELATEMNSAIFTALGDGTGGKATLEDDGTDRPAGGQETGIRRMVDEVADAHLISFEQEIMSATDPAELLTRLGDWAVRQISGNTRFLQDAIRDLSRGWGDANTIANLSEGLQQALTTAAPDASQLVIAGAVSRVIQMVTPQLHEEEQQEVVRRKKRGELNPFGGAACIFVNRANYGEERYKQFKAAKYMRHLAWWDFTVRAIAKALRQAMMFSPSRVGIGFVLDDKLLGLCRNDAEFVMINPEPLEAVVDKFRDRPFIAASYIHGIACHELAHADQISRHGNGNHNRDWSIDREAFASSTLFLLPLIEEAGAKLLKMKKRHRAKPQPKQPDKAAMDQIAALETALAEARLHLERAEKERDESTKLLDQRSSFLHRLESLVHVHDFRHWVAQNPNILPLGLDLDHFTTFMTSPSGVEKLLARVDRQFAEEYSKRLANLPGGPTGPDTHAAYAAAYHAACGCSGSDGYDPEIESKRAPAHAAFTGGLSAPYHHFPHDLLRERNIPRSKWPSLVARARAAVAQGREVELEHTDDLHEAAKIARDHLVEWFRDHGDFRYYDELAKMESGHAGAGRSRGRSATVCPPTQRGVSATAKGYPKGAEAFERAKTRMGSKARSRGWNMVKKAAVPVLGRYGYQLGKELGCGTFACAYSLRGQAGLVAKFSGDPADAAAWALIMKIAKRRRRWPSGLARVDCVEALPNVVPPEAGKDSGRRVYLFLQEQMYPLDEAEEDFFDSDAVSAAILDGDEDAIADLCDEWGMDFDEVLGIAATVSWLEDQGIVWHDLHGGNIMRGSDDQLKIMDLGYSVVPKVEIPVMAADHTAWRLETAGRVPSARALTKELLTP